MSVFDATNQYTQWPPSKFQEPREVEHGIHLKKSMAEITEHWWSQRWLKIIDEFGLGVRWERAKLYAEKGQVISVGIENGLVKAFVQGADEEPYRVTISVKTIPKPIWTAILSDLGKTSFFAISLASGSFPAEEHISQVFRENGVLLFPDRQGELHTKCTCLDWSNPCKHIAAVYLILAAQFDRDPFLLFKLRGLEQSELFSLTKPASQAAGGSPAPNPEAVEMNSLTIAPPLLPEAAAATTSVCLRFWKSSVVASEVLGEWNAQKEVASLPVSLGDFPFWQGKENFLQKIHCAYKSAPDFTKNTLAKRASSAF